MSLKSWDVSVDMDNKPRLYTADTAFGRLSIERKHRGEVVGWEAVACGQCIWNPKDPGTCLERCHAPYGLWHNPRQARRAIHEHMRTSVEALLGQYEKFFGSLTDIPTIGALMDEVESAA